MPPHSGGGGDGGGSSSGHWRVALTPQQQREVDRFLEQEREAARRAEAEARANAQIAAERKERDRAARAARDRAARAARDAELEARWAGFARDADGVAGSCCDGGDFGSAAEHACCGSSGLCCACAIGKDPNCCCCGAGREGSCGDACGCGVRLGTKLNAIARWHVERRRRPRPCGRCCGCFWSFVLALASPTASLGMPLLTLLGWSLSRGIFAGFLCGTVLFVLATCGLTHGLYECIPGGRRARRAFYNVASEAACAHNQLPVAATAVAAAGHAVAVGAPPPVAAPTASASAAMVM